ncbi:hypothetical protein [Amycolatopsis sp. NPDC051128]|uniref:hypothetical protein n=1 Tax=Amycolatopsis sp. NPDC051128 TaxID=3155412 RepID=UPI003439E206
MTVLDVAVVGGGPAGHSWITVDDVLDRSGASLHAGIFTARLDRALTAARLLEAGGVMINDRSNSPQPASVMRYSRSCPGAESRSRRARSGWCRPSPPVSAPCSSIDRMRDTPSRPAAWS